MHVPMLFCNVALGVLSFRVFVAKKEIVIITALLAAQRL